MRGVRSGYDDCCVLSFRLLILCVPTPTASYPTLILIRDKKIFKVGLGLADDVMDFL